MPKRDPKTHTGEKGRARRSAGSATGYLCPLCDQAYSTDVGIRRHAVRKHGMAWHSDGSVTPMSPAVLSESKNRLRLQQRNSKQRRKYRLKLAKRIGEVSEVPFPDDVGSASGGTELSVSRSPPSTSGVGMGEVAGRRIWCRRVTGPPASAVTSGRDSKAGDWRSGLPSTSSVGVGRVSPPDVGGVEAPSFFDDWDELHLDRLISDPPSLEPAGLIPVPRPSSEDLVRAAEFMDRVAQTGPPSRHDKGVQASPVVVGLLPTPVGLLYQELADKVLEWDRMETGELVGRLIAESGRDLPAADRILLEVTVASMIVGMRTLARNLQDQYERFRQITHETKVQSVVKSLIDESAQRRFWDVDASYQPTVYLEVDESSSSSEERGSPIANMEEEDALSISSEEERDEEWDPRDAQFEDDPYL